MADELLFIRGLFARPRKVGAIAPSSPALARAIAAQIDPERPGPVLELGPGTGVVTEAILERGVAPERITAIEFDADFAQRLAQRYPRIHVVNGDAFALTRKVAEERGGRFSAIISGLPLLNFPMRMRKDLIETALQHLPDGAPLIQFSYGLHSPVAPPSGASVALAAFVFLNLPPARVWVYRRG